MTADGYGFQTRDLTRTFRATRALDGVNMHADRGQVMGLLGPNGAGKTTLIRILATLLRADGGQATVAGFDVASQPDQVRRRIALCGQHTTVDEELSGSANLLLIGQLLGMPRRAARQRAVDLLAAMHLDDAASRPVRTWSGGMRRRLDLAASLVGHPEVLFLDEPSVGLDPAAREDLWQTIRAVAAAGATVLLTTQYLEEADALADTIAVIDHGRVTACGTPEELKRQVGCRTAVVRLEHAADADAAVAVLTAVAGRAPQRATAREFAVPVDSTGTFLELGTRLHDQRLGVAELAWRLPSLDEVFLALTGAQGPTPDPAGSDT